VPLNKTAVAALRAHRARQSEERLRSLGWQEIGLVFPNRVGKPINPSNLYHREYKPLLKHAGLEDEGFTFHSLRRTFASALCNKRQYPKVIQSLLGHSSITQTMDTYSHLMGGMEGGAVEGLDEVFGETKAS
jgi:integrase